MDRLASASGDQSQVALGWRSLVMSRTTRRAECTYNTTVLEFFSMARNSRRLIRPDDGKPNGLGLGLFLSRQAVLIMVVTFGLKLHPAHDLLCAFGSIESKSCRDELHPVINVNQKRRVRLAVAHHDFSAGRLGNREKE